MKKKILILVIILSLTVSVSGKPAEGNNYTNLEKEETGMTCGDNICSDREIGLCPEDCDPDFEPPAEDSASANTQQQSPPQPEENRSAPTVDEESQMGEESSLFSGTSLVILSLSTVSLMLAGVLYRYDKKKENSEKEDFQELVDWAEKQADKGYKAKQIKTFMKENGIKEEKVRKAIRKSSIDDNPFS